MQSNIANLIAKISRDLTYPGLLRARLGRIEPVHTISQAPVIPEGLHEPVLGYTVRSFTDPKS